MKSTKTVQIMARYFIHRNRHVVYAVRSSNGQDTYYTTIINGKATGCTCPATKPCYHMTQLETVEQSRQVAAQVTPDEIAAQAVAANMRKLADYRLGKAQDAYEQLGKTKQVSWVYSLRCPHMVPVGKEHEECGACLDKIFG